MTGTLYLCATPIGNLEDITFRVLRTLKEVDLIAAEDTRNSIKLLNHFEIKTPMTSYHEFNKIDKAYQLVAKLKEGKNIALITDAGTPGISDPGVGYSAHLLRGGRACYLASRAAACITALTMSGRPTRRFAFEAFLPRDKKERARVIEELKNETRTIIIYEAPHHLIKTVTELYNALGDRELTVCRELTKKHEEKVQTTFSELLERSRTQEPRGEYVLVICGRNVAEIAKEQQESWEAMPLEAHMAHYESQGIDRKEAMKLVAKDRGVSKRDIYKQLL